MATLNDSPIRYYTFPAPCLAVVESPATGVTSTDTGPKNQKEESPPAHTPETDASPELRQLTAPLEANGLTVEQTDDETLTIERLGQTHHIRPGEGIQNDGALRSKLETIVDDAI